MIENRVNIVLAGQEEWTNIEFSTKKKHINEHLLQVVCQEIA